MSNLKVGLPVTGRVDNVTTFGAFVDIGVEETAFVPVHRFPARSSNNANHSLQRKHSHQRKEDPHATPSGINQMSLHLGDRVKATVESFSIQMKRISLRDVELIT